MEPDDFDISALDSIVLTTTTTLDNTISVPITDVSTVTIDDYTADTIDFSDLVFTTSRDEKRTILRNNGSIPIDIWAKMYNNRVLDIKDDDDEFCF